VNRDSAVLEAGQTKVGPGQRGSTSVPLTPRQERLWVLDNLVPELSAHNVTSALRLVGRLDITALQESLDAELRRHSKLRSTFPAEQGRPMQVTVDDLRVRPEVFDISVVPVELRAAEAQRLLAEEARRHFDLARGPLLRAGVVRLADEEHLLVVTTHEIMCDSASLDRLLQSLGESHAAHTPGLQTQAPRDLPDMSAPVVDAQQRYWIEQLKGAATLDLPSDFPRPPIRTYRGSTESFVVPASVAAGLKSLAGQEETSLFEVLLAAFQVVLLRYTNQEDIVVGAPLPESTPALAGEVCGPPANLVVLRTDLSGNPTFRELLARAHRVVRGAYANGDLPFERLVAALQPSRDQSRTPLFQAAIVLDSGGSALSHFHGLASERLSIHNSGARYDLTLRVSWDAERLSAALEYSTDLFTVARMRRLCGHLQTLLAGVLADPDQRIRSVPLLTDAERHQQLVAWNHTVAEYPSQMGVHHLVEAQAARVPDAVAITFEDHAITYRELNQRANRFARYLQRLGVGPEVIVGVHLERSIDMVVALLAIHKAGGAYLPLDPLFPSERLAYMVDDSRAAIVVTQARLAGTLSTGQAEVVQVDTDWPRIEEHAADDLQWSAAADRLAYVLYTSGSTGRPKGVQVLHRGVVNFLTTMRWRPGLSSDDVLLSVTTLSFDIAGLELFLPLSTGARVVLVGSAVAASGAHLLAAMQTSGATVMQATPATWRMLLTAGWKGSPGLRVLCGGEALPGDLAAQLLPRCQSLWNMYGPTETTIWSTVYPVTAAADSVVSIGRPIANTQVYVLDAGLQPVPIGVAGELFIGGDGLARGYLNRPELTAERFILDPFAADRSARLYRTGDLVRWREDGNLEYLQRVDTQVKIRGYRIELGEIENTLNAHPGVKEAVVLAREDEPGDQRLVAYLILDQEPPPTTSELRVALREKLPEYMVPAIFVTLDALPLTPNGKVDRKALPAPDQSRPELERAFVAPRNAIETRLAEIWQDLLKVDSVGVKDDFFELGGHSLLVAPLFARIEKALGVDLPLATIFRTTTVEQLAALMRDERPARGHSSVVPIRRGGTQPTLFCVHGGQGTTLVFLKLAQLLGDDQPVSGVEALGLEDGQGSPHTRVEEFAAQYVADIRAVQPHGPYYLSGYCFGGVVAFEMAQQLRRDGQEVALLVLFNAPHPRNVLESEWRAPESANAKLQRRKREFTQLGLKQRYDAIRGIVTWRFNWAEMRVYQRLAQLYVASGVRLPRRFRRMYLLDHTNRAQDMYAPSVYPGQLVLFRGDGLYRIPELGWRDFVAGGIEAYAVPGSHHQNSDMMTEPYVHTVVAHLQRVLQRTQNGQASAHS
jgi:amino acid adenylation domain-containing protein